MPQRLSGGWSALVAKALHALDEVDHFSKGVAAQRMNCRHLHWMRRYSSTEKQTGWRPRRRYRVTTRKWLESKDNMIKVSSAFSGLKAIFPINGICRFMNQPKFITHGQYPALYHPLMFTCVAVFGMIWSCVSRFEISFSGLGPDRGRCSIRNIADKLYLQIYLKTIALEVAFRSKSASENCCAHKRPFFSHGGDGYFASA